MKKEINISVQNQLGLHARASAKLVNEAKRFSCQITLSHGDRLVNAKSIMSVMMLSAAQGSELTLSADGEDAEQAVEAIQKLFNNLFGEGR